MKAKIYLSILILYLISYTSYVYCLASYKCDLDKMKVWNYTSIGSLLLTTFIFEELQSFYVRQLLIISKVTILVTFIVIILTSLQIVSDPYKTLFIFYGTNIVISTMALNLTRFGYFKDINESNDSTAE